MMENRWIQYAIILSAGMSTAAAFMLNNTEKYKYFFWPLLIISLAVFVQAVRRVTEK